MSQQKEDENLTEEAINYTENGTYGSDCSANRKRSIRKKAGKLAMKEGEVYYEKKPGQVCRWLSDALINAGQKLLKDAYPHIGGLQPTILGMILAFEVQRKQFVQVLHINENHWVTASNIGCPVATVDIFDSM